MSNWIHFKVLLKKNFITLRRNLCFALFFLILPLVSMGIFTLIKYLLSDGIIEEKHNYEKMFFTNNQVLSKTEVLSVQFSDIPEINYMKYSSFLNCVAMKLYNYGLVGTDDVLKNFQEIEDILKQKFMFNGKHFATQEEVFDIVRNDKEDSYCFALKIDKFDKEKQEYEFQVSWLRKNIPDTNRPPYDPQTRTPTFDNWDKYNRNGFLAIYYLIAESILKYNGKQDIKIDIAYLPMKTPSYSSVDPQVTEQLSQNFPFFFMFTFLIPLYYIVQKLAEEKESKSREGMKMMGLKDSSYFTSWFVFFGSIVLFMSLVIVGMVSINVFSQSNKFLIFLLAFFYGLSLFGFSLCIVALLPTQRSSATAASLLHVITYFIVFAIKDPDTSSGVKIILSILPNVGMSFGIYNLYHFETDSTGLGFNNVSVWYNNMTYTASILSLVFNTFFYLGLGLYLDQVVPSQYGVAKKWYFLCTRNFWCSRRNERRAIRDENNKSLLNQSFEDLENKEEIDPADFEPVAEGLRRQEQTNDCLKIRGLRKAFGEKVAVDNTNITMYNGQIFALLGHNGAGKTTTISMLTGLIEATKGKASVFGIDIFNQMDDMRKILGVCPQHDVLFEFLTPKEHLQLFASFKGTPSHLIDELVDKMIKDIDLVTVENQMAKTLSGGQKRKLSVGCAMIGNSKIVILDEPTSGMDTSSRRRLWEMLKENKNGRIVILTTHYMDEADILGDRIGIMADGKVKCCGSSLFLKNRYGVGYNLVIAKKTRDPAPQIDDFIFNKINGVKKLQEVSSEMNFQLPTQSSSQFKDFFNLLDNNLDELGIRSYGVGITTLEEVFLKIGKGENEDEEDDEELRKFTLDRFENNSKKKITPQKEQEKLESINNLDDYSIAEQHEVGVMKVFMTNLSALLKKKFLLQIRDPRTLIIEIIFPIVFIFAGLGLSTIQFFKDGHPRLLSPTIFPSPNYLMYNSPTALQGDNSIDFVNNYFSRNVSEWTKPYVVPLQVKQGDYQYMVNQLDDAIFDIASKDNMPMYGNYFYYNLNKAKGEYAIFTLVNATSQDGVVAFATEIHEAVLRDIIDPKLKLTVYSTPFPLTLLENGVLSAAAGTSSSILFSIAYMMVSNSLISNIIGERKRNVKNQMIISGVSIPAYWFSHYLVDLLFQAPPSICAIIGIYAFDLDLPDAWVIILIFIFANPVFVYFFSFLFENESAASIITRLIYILLGSIVPIAISFLQVFPTTKDAGKILRWFFYVFPIFSLNFGIQNIANRKVFAQVEKRDVIDPLDFLVAGPSVAFMIADIAIYWVIIFLFEKKIFSAMISIFTRRGHRHHEDQQASEILPPEDEDIIEEEQKVAQSRPDENTVRLNQVRKYYGKTLAVEKVSFGLEYGECFALLGVSGAGKTTTFKCLIGEETPTSGTVHINGHDVTTREGFEQARRLIGYCPQFDAIFDGLTVREHLEFYAKVKGVLENYRGPIVERQLDEMDLREYQNVRAEKLSGGNKRKLSVAMAMIGNPPIVFLDEPSTGVDPKAKRFMWTIVSKISTMRKKSSVIITTHSMEEAEALCTKMGIMVAGKFKCFGSSQHIKAKYGTGYEIEVKIRNMKPEEITEIKNANELQDMPITYNQIEGILTKLDCGDLISEITKDGVGQDFYNQLQTGSGTIFLDELIKWSYTESRGAALIEKFESMFVTVEVLEHYNNSYKIKVSRDNYSIGYLFGMMEDIKGEYQINEYSVSQTTLEQIFNNFAKEAEKGVSFIVLTSHFLECAQEDNSGSKKD